MYLSTIEDRIYNKPLGELSHDKILISCLNAYSFNILQKDNLFKYAILSSHVLLPDGIAIVYALRFLNKIRLSKISGHMLFEYELKRLDRANGSCFFLGSSQSTICLIKNRIRLEHPNIRADFFSPPFKKEFSFKENQEMINNINECQPDVLFIGMTAPKQEKWAAAHFNDLKTKRICCIGAVFDFYAGTSKVAPVWMINLGLEWLHRLIEEPKRLWRRYIFGNPEFLAYIFKEKFKISLFKSKV